MKTRIRKTIVILIIILIIISYIYRQGSIKKHLFWNNKQPIILHNKNSTTGIIKELVNLHILDTPSNMKQIIFNNDNIDTLINFVNNHFEEKALITQSYINWQLPNSLLYGLKGNDLYGVIVGNIVYLNIFNKRYKTIYVDYLCIDKKYRTQNYTPLLISFIIDYMKKNECYISLFKSDNTKHHFKHFYETNYYTLDVKSYYKRNKIISNNKIVNLYNSISNKRDSLIDSAGTNVSIRRLNNIDELSILFDIYTICNHTYKVYEEIDKKTFYNKLSNNIVNVSVFELDNKIIGYIVLTKLYYPKIQSNIYDIYHFFISDPVYLTTTFLTKLIKYFVDYNILYISTLSNETTAFLIKNLNMLKGAKTYYYLYNYNINIASKDVLLF